MNFLRLIFGVMLATISTQTISASSANAASVQRFVKEHPNSVILLERKGCPFCAYVRPLFNSVIKKYAAQHTVSFLSVDISADPYNFQKVYHFKTVPTFLYFKDGIEQPLYRHGSDNRTLKQSYIETIIETLYF